MYESIRFARCEQSAQDAATRRFWRIPHRTLRDNAQAPSRTALIRRLGALARAQDTLTANAWEGAPLGQIVAAELSPYAGRFAMDGPLVNIAGTMAQTFSLLLHELATNAAKHGALSNADGSISVSWTIEGHGDTARLRFSWRESGGPTVSEPAQKGFGSALLEAALPANEGAGLRFAPEGLTYEIDVPLLAISANASGE